MGRGGRYNKRGGGRGGRGGRGGKRGGGGGGDKPYADNRLSFDQVPKENEKFERYYNTLNIVSEGPEREAFWSAFKRELPNAFRFCGSKGHALSVRKNLTERFFPLIKEIEHNGEPVEVPKVMPWYPEGLAYSMTTPKHVVRKYEPFKEFQKFLVSETGVGNISRQEQVSMIPPLMMDVQPHHAVLDLCAAPGSKSAQLVELLHLGEEERVGRALTGLKEGQKGAEGDFGRTTGLLVANDVNYQRAQMLVHQVKRLNSPNLIVTNHDATMFPSMQLPSNPKHPQYLKFDRVLADVPCSGDGTARKNPNVWKDWSPVNAMGLYITQVRILVRSLQMLKSGGRVVYSTCSMNPLENEAVVSSAIERCGGIKKVKLIDSSDKLPLLKRSKGLNDWSIMARSGQIYESWPEAQQFEGEGSKVVPGMFPPEAGENIPLELCMRLYPHQQDTGGFFVAVLEKQSEIKAKPENESKCFSRNWVFNEPEKAPVSAMLNELPNAKADQNGNMQLPSLDAATTGAPAGAAHSDVSAAARQNQPVEDFITNPKRKAEDEPADGTGMAKKSRTAAGDVEDNGNVTMPDAALAPTIDEHLPVPPTHELSRQVDGAKTGESTAPSTSASTPGAPVSVDGPVKEAVSTAPFEKAIPADLQAPPPRRRNNDATDESFKYLSPVHPELESVYTFYQLHPSFPRDRFLVRNPAGDPVKGIYYSSTLVRDILTANENRGFKFVHAGVKMFMKQDVQNQPDVCKWRIQTEGLPIVEGWVGEGRVVRLWKRSTLRKLLVEMFPRVGGAEGSEGWRALGEIGERVRDLGMGCCVLRVIGKSDVGPMGLGGGEGASDDEGFEEGLTLPLWRSMHSLNLMLPKEERKAMLLRIYNEDVELVNHSDKNQRDTDAAATGGRSGPSTGREGDKGQAGSWSGQADAEELQKKISNAPDDPADEATAGAAEDGANVAEDAGDVSRRAMDEAEGSGMAVEQDSVAEEDALRSKRIEVEESEEMKVKEAMPEREGEGDVSNPNT